MSSRSGAAASRRAFWSADRSKSTAASLRCPDTGVTSAGRCAMLRRHGPARHGRTGVAAGRVPGAGSDAHLPWHYGVGLPPRFDDLAEDGGLRAALAGGVGRPTAGSGSRGPRSTAAGASGALENYVVIEELARARAPELVGPHRHQPGRARPCWPTAPTSRRSAASPASSRPTSCGASSSASPTPAATWPRSAPGPSPVEGGYRVNGPQGLDLLRPVRRLGPLPDPQRPRRRRSASRASPRSSWTCTPPGVGCARSSSRPARPSSTRSSCDDVFVPDDRLVGPEGGGWRVAGSTLAHERGINPRQLVIHAPAHRGAPPAWPSQRQLRRLAPAPAAGPGRHRGPALPAAQLALADPPAPRARQPGPEGSALKLYWSEMSKRLHRRRSTCSARPPRCGEGAEGNPADGRLAALVALLPGGLDLRRHQRDPAHVVGERVLGLPRAEPSPAGPAPARQDGRLREDERVP